MKGGFTSSGGASMYGGVTVYGGLTSSGGLTLSSTLPVPQGGTGSSTFTQNGVLYGNGSSAIGATAAGSSTSVLTANSAGTPVFNTNPQVASLTIVGNALPVLDITTSSFFSPAVRITDGSSTPNQWLIFSGLNTTTDGVFAIQDRRQVATRLQIGTTGTVSIFQNLQVGAAIGTTAGGNGVGFTLGNANQVGVFFGSGVPTIAAGQGSLYLRTDGSSTSRMYVSTTNLGSSSAWTPMLSAS